MQMEKDIKVNGVDLRLKKLDAFEQYEMMDILYPVAVEVIGTTAANFSKMSDAEFVGFTVVQILKAMPSDMRRKLIFSHLLSERAVGLVINGAEMPLIGQAGNGQRTVMNQNLSDIADLLEVAAESFKFNFERFFEKLLQLKAQKLK